MATSGFSAHSDTEIVRRVLSGAKEEFSEFLSRDEIMIRTVIQRHVPLCHVDDLVQLTFISAYESLASYQNHGSFKAWLSTIARRRCCDYWRTAHSKWEIPWSAAEDSETGFADNLAGPLSKSFQEEAEGTQELRQRLGRALSALGPDAKRTLLLRFVHDCSVEQTARVMRCTPENVRVRTFRAIRQLRQLLSEEEIEEQIRLAA
jgi:RNA polymerase sigma-70 factor, ECF subfamily